MKIGITCYPTYGGSGIVATELGLELAHARPRGAFHLVLAADPADRSHSPTSTTTRSKFHGIRCSNIRRMTSRWPRGWPRSPEIYDLDLLHVHYAIPHSVSAMLARQMLACDHKRKSRKLPYVTTLHGTDITLVGADPSYLPITRFSIDQSDGVTSISQYLARANVRGLRDHESDQGHSELRELRHVSPHAGDHAAHARSTPSPTRRSWCTCRISVR